MQLSRHSRICHLVLVLCSYTLNIFAQIPPTCCPDPLPKDDFNSTPFLIAAGGLVVLGGSYFYVKSKGPKIAINDHLPTYLLSRNILPNEDAINLMYSLNSSLNGKTSIRENRKLVDPIFPEITINNITPIDNSTGVSITNSQSIKNQIGLLKSNIESHRSSKFSYVTPDSVFLKNIASDLSEIEKVVSNIENNLGQSNDVIISLTIDLILVLNQTLEGLKNDSSELEKNSILIKDILDNLLDISNSNILSSNMEERNNFSTLNTKNNLENILASNQSQSSGLEDKYQSDKIIVIANTPAANANSKLLKAFAFAVYTFDENGKPITKGPEVEGKFMVKYAMPALKDEIETHKEAKGLASFSKAMLPPAKLYIIVLDISDGGKAITLQNPLIDFKVAFQNSERENINNQEYIIVPIYIAK